MPVVEKSTQGSEARFHGPPSHCVTLPGITLFHERPPLSLTSPTSPREPPLLQRSCWWPTRRRFGSVGSAATQGSISVAGYSVPICFATLSAVQPANGSPLVTRTSLPTSAAEAVLRPRATTLVAASPNEARRLTGRLTDALRMLCS